MEIAWDYPWSSAAHYVTKVADRATDTNPYLGKFTDYDRKQYGDALVSNVDEPVIHQSISSNIIGSRAYSRKLKIDRGHYRLKKGKLDVNV